MLAVVNGGEVKFSIQDMMEPKCLKTFNFQREIKHCFIFVDTFPSTVLLHKELPTRLC